ncbi:hypothetical protein Tco_0634853 [Tanacetum coccineum]
MTNSHQQSIADASSKNHPPSLLIKREVMFFFTSWQGIFMRYIDGKKAYGKMLKDSITNGPYQMKEMNDPGNLTGDPIVQPHKRLQKEEDLEGNDKLRFEADIDAMNFILLGIPNDIYNSVDACKTAQAMWNRVEYDLLYDFLKQNEVNVNASKAKRAAKAHDPLVDVQTKNVGNVGSVGETCVVMLGVHGLLLIVTSATRRVIMLEHARNQEFETPTTSDKLNALCIMMAHIQTVANGSDAEPSYDLHFVNEVKDPSSSFFERLFSNSDHEQSHHEQHETIKTTYDDDQIDSNIIFYDSDEDFNSDKVKKDNALLTKELETYKERVCVFENKLENKYDYKTVYNEALNREKKLSAQIQTQILVEKRKTESLKENFKKQEDKYLDDILRLEAKLKDHERIIYKMDHSLQTIHMIGPKPNSFYDPSLKSGLGYQNPCRLQKAIAQTPKLYSATSLRDSKVHVHVHDSEEILEDAKKS